MTKNRQNAGIWRSEIVDRGWWNTDLHEGYLLGVITQYPSILMLVAPARINPIVIQIAQ
jgi:hypothetical protein